MVFADDYKKGVPNGKQKVAIGAPSEITKNRMESYTYCSRQKIKLFDGISRGGNNAMVKMTYRI